MWKLFFQTLMSEYTRIKKPFGCHIFDKKFSKLSCQNILRWKIIWLLFMRQDWTLMSEYTRIKKPFGCHICDKKFSKLSCHNTLWWKTIIKYLCDMKFFLTLIIMEDACCSCLFVKCRCCFRNFEKWKVFLWSSQMVIHLSVFWQGSLENFLSHEWQSNGFQMSVFWHKRSKNI